MIGAAVRLDSKTAISPQLPLGTETMRCLDDRDQQRRADRTDRGDLAEQLERLVLPALGQQFAPHLLAQRPQRIELLVVELRPAAHTRLGDLAEPRGTVARRIDLLPRTSNPPASVDRLQSTHHPYQIFADGQVTA